MTFHGSSAQVLGSRDLGVGAAGGEELQDLPLAWTQVGDSRMRGWLGSRVRRHERSDVLQSELPIGAMFGHDGATVSEGHQPRVRDGLGDPARLSEFDDHVIVRVDDQGGCHDLGKVRGRVRRQPPGNAKLVPSGTWQNWLSRCQGATGSGQPSRAMFDGIPGQLRVPTAP